MVSNVQPSNNNCFIRRFLFSSCNRILISSNFSGVAVGRLYSVFSVELLTKPKLLSFRFDRRFLLLRSECIAAIIVPSPPIISNFLSETNTFFDIEIHFKNFQVPDFY